MNTEDRLKKLEERTAFQEKMIRKIGEVMGEFDFDALLEDVEAEVTAEEAVKVEDQEDKNKEIENEFDDLLDNMSEVETEKDEELDYLLDETEETAEVKPYEKGNTKGVLGTEQENLVPDVNEALWGKDEGPVPQPVNVTQAADSGIEFAEETKAYIRAKSDIELRRKSLAQEQKELKEEFKDAGVDIKTADAAAKEIARRIKQSADEADMIEKTMKIFEEDDGIYSTIVALND